MKAEFDARIKEKPFAMSWKNALCGFTDSLKEDGIINYEGLSDLDKLCLYVYAWNKSGFLPRKHGILKQFSWTNYRLQKMIKSLGGAITTEPTFNEHTGLISGRGYYFNSL